MAGAFETLEMSWQGYDVVPVPPEDFKVAVAAIIDYLDGIEGPAALELPNANIKLDRDEQNNYVVWLRVGEVDLDSIT